MQDFDDDDLHVDLTPLIDVIFMLVIFFIMTMSFTLPVVDFTLPQSTTAQIEKINNALRINIDRNGKITVEQQELSLEQLTTLVKDQSLAASNSQQDFSLELVIDQNTITQHLIEIADLARLYTNGKLSVISTPIEKQP